MNNLFHKFKGTSLIKEMFLFVVFNEKIIKITGLRKEEMKEILNESN